MKTRAKVIVVTLCGTLSLGIFVTRFTNRLYPGLSIAVLLGSLILTILLISQKKGESIVPFLVGVCVLGVFYRVYVFVFPASMIGLDPDTSALSVQRIAMSGDTSSIVSNFYQELPLYHVFGATHTLISGQPAPDAMVIYPIAMGIVLPLCASLVAMWVTTEHSTMAGGLAALITAVALVSVRHAYWTIPQTMGVLLWGVIFVSLTRYISTHDRRHALISVVVLPILFFTHKLPGLIVLITLLGFIAMLGLQQLRSRQEQYVSSSFVTLLLLSGIILFFQWDYATDYLGWVLFQLSRLSDPSFFGLGTGAGGAESGDSLPLNELPVMIPGQGLAGTILRRGHGIVFIPLAGLAWMHFYFSPDQRKAKYFLLAGVAAPMPLLVFGVLTTWFGPMRPLFFVEFLLAAILGAWFADLRDRIPTRQGLVRSVLVLVVGIILFTQVFAVLALPDAPTEPRYYLTSDEVNAKSFGHQYVQGEIHTDGYYQSEIIPAEIARGRDSTQYQKIGWYLYNQSIDESGYERILYRERGVIHRTDGGIPNLRLTYDPRPEFDQLYNRIYSNGGASHYVSEN